MAVIGYARVSTGEQTLEPQLLELRAAGCGRIVEEHASGGNRSRPQLNRLLDQIKAGDTIVVVRLDRLARSLMHLLDVIKHLEDKGAHFRSLGDPIDTSTPQGRFSLQVMGAVAELERALIQERTKAGLKAARAEGRVGGNPGLRDRNRGAIRKNAAARDEVYMNSLLESAEYWVPIVRRYRPGLRWESIVAMVNANLPMGKTEWTVRKLKRAVDRYIREGMLSKDVLGRSPAPPPDDRLMAIIAALATNAPDMTLDQIARKLESMRERTPRGSAKWANSSVKMLLDRAKDHGLLSSKD